MRHSASYHTVCHFVTFVSALLFVAAMCVATTRSPLCLTLAFLQCPLPLPCSVLSNNPSASQVSMSRHTFDDIIDSMSVQMFSSEQINAMIAGADAMQVRLGAWDGTSMQGQGCWAGTAMHHACSHACSQAWTPCRCARAGTCMQGLGRD